MTDNKPNEGMRSEPVKAEEVNIAGRKEPLQSFVPCQQITHRVFPGVDLVYNNIHLQTLNTGEIPVDEMIEIIHCREGRMECSLREGYCYISPGDLMIIRSKDKDGDMYFPQNHYHGISVRIDPGKASESISGILDDVMVEPRRIAEKFCGGGRCFIARSNESFEHIFSELYSVPGEIRKGYFKIKILEIMLFLSAMDITRDEYESREVSENQVKLAKAVNEYLEKNMSERVTLKQLAEEFHVSGTHLKNTFKAVYGVPVYTFVRNRKIEKAAYLLEHTDKAVMEIAGECGYDNSSKFAEAFKKLKGVTPIKYRARRKGRD